MKDQSHFDTYYDLGQLLTYFNTNDENFSKSTSVKCPACKKTTKVAKIEMAFSPHILVQEMKKKVNSII